MSETKEQGIACAHCGKEVSSTVYRQCGTCGEIVCEECAPDPCCRETEEHQPKSAEPVEGSPEVTA
ncbi:MAG: hypothetical protein GX100_04840 [candidate division WS1 bacterium]|jgi:hypothetical protein|nr:hypothetical protein [candidate division WS1 bacterium]